MTSILLEATKSTGSSATERERLGVIPESLPSPGDMDLRDSTSKPDLSQLAYAQSFSTALNPNCTIPYLVYMCVHIHSAAKQ